MQIANSWPTRVLAYLFKDTSYIPRVAAAGVTADHFKQVRSVGSNFEYAETDESRLFNSAIWYYEQYQQVLTPGVLAEELSKRGADRFNIERYVSVVNKLSSIECVPEEFDYCVKQLQGAFTGTELSIAMDKAQKSLKEFKVWEAVDGLRTKVLSLGATRIDDEKPLSLRKWAKSAYDEYLEKAENPEVHIGLPFGIPELDAATGGAMRQELTIFASRTNVGKSMALLNIALNMVESGFNVVFATREMATAWQLHRVAAKLGGGSFDINSFKSFQLDNAQLEIFKQSMDKLNRSDSDMFILPPNLCECCGQVGAEITLLSQEHKIDAIVVDYLNELKPTAQLRGAVSNQDHQSQAQIAQELKDLSIDWNCPVITAAQDNRLASGDNAEIVGTEAVALSDFIPNKAGLLLRMYQTRIDQVERMVTVRGVKTRHGGKFTIRIPERFESGILGLVHDPSFSNLTQVRVGRV